MSIVPSKRQYQAFLREVKSRHRGDERAQSKASGRKHVLGHGGSRHAVHLLLCWLWPKRKAIILALLLGFSVAAMQMVEPIFVRYIIDVVLLADGVDSQTKLRHLSFAGAIYLSVVC